MINVLIVDDMIILRECLKMAICQDEEFRVVGCGGDGKEAVMLCKELQPDIILMDLNMPIYSGHDAIIDIKKFGFRTNILVLSSEGDEKNIATAFKNGADGYVLKDIEPNELFMVMKKAFAGEKYIHECAFYLGQEAISFRKNSVHLDTHWNVEITGREKDVMDLVMQGMTNEEIGECLGLSAGRAKNIVAELISKFMLKNRTQLAVMSMKLRIQEERAVVYSE